MRSAVRTIILRALQSEVWPFSHQTVIQLVGKLSMVSG